MYLLQHCADIATGLSFARIMQEGGQVLWGPHRDNQLIPSLAENSCPLRNCASSALDAPGVGQVAATQPPAQQPRWTPGCADITHTHTFQYPHEYTGGIHG